MMTAVLVDAMVPGLSGWIQVRESQKVRVSGLGAGELQLMFHGPGIAAHLDVLRDGLFDIPEGAVRVKARLKEAGEDTRLHVDLEY